MCWRLSVSGSRRDSCKALSGGHHETIHGGITAGVFTWDGSAGGSGAAVRRKGRGEEGGRGDQGSRQGHGRRSQACRQSDGKRREEGCVSHQEGGDRRRSRYLRGRFSSGGEDRGCGGSRVFQSRRRGQEVTHWRASRPASSRCLAPCAGACEDATDAPGVMTIRSRRGVPFAGKTT